jgi:hypothetical protein
MHGCHGSSCALLLTLAGCLAGCVGDFAKDETDSGLKVVVRLTTPTVQASVNGSVEVQGTAFLTTRDGDFVPNTYLHLSCASGSFNFPYGTHQDTTDVTGWINFAYIVDGSAGPGVRTVRGTSGAATGEAELRVNMPDWYVDSLALIVPADTIYLDEPSWTTVMAWVRDSAYAPIATVPIYYTYPGSENWANEQVPTTNQTGLAELVIHLNSPGDYCVNATAGRRQKTACFTLVELTPTPQ